MLYAIYKKLRLFWFGFMLALGLLVGIGIRSGDIDPAELQAQILKYSFEYVRNNPQALNRAMEVYASVFETQPAPTGSLTPGLKKAPPSGSLSALKERQRLDQIMQVPPIR